MRIVFAGHKERGVRCLDALVSAGHDIVAVLAHASAPATAPASVPAAARRVGAPLFQPDDPSEPALVAEFQSLSPDVAVLAGYAPIVREPFISLARFGCVNLHGGKLPQYRGSSPMNWALMNGEREFTLSIIKVDAGVDSGPVLLERTFAIGPDDTIADLQLIANETFPVMLVETLAQLAAGSAHPRLQDDASAGYYPLRFPDDGLVVWDAFTAAQVHNRIRALTEPYPGAFTMHAGRQVKLLRSRLAKRAYYGEPGRVYMKTDRGLLVCASDRCLWIERARYEDDGSDAVATIARYERLLTMRGAALDVLAGLVPR